MLNEHKSSGEASAAASPAKVRHEDWRICGERLGGEARLEVRFPYTGELVGSVPLAEPHHVRRALERAHAFRSELSRYERHLILSRTRELLVERSALFAHSIVAESGLCIRDARHEVMRAADVLSSAAAQALVDDGKVFSCDVGPHGRKRRVYTQRDPLLGVIVAITPFNHPLNQIVHKVAPSVATNNRMVLKPSEKTPLTALMFADLLYEAGLPGPMLTVITGKPDVIGPDLLRAPEVDVVSFTGGVAAGKIVAKSAVYKRQILELGGNDPIIVMEDADLEEAVELTVAGAYRNSGQRCTAIKRILVHEKVSDAFVEALVSATSALRAGDPFDEASDLGTVIDAAAAQCIERRVQSAILDGARLRHGHRREGALYLPTVLDGVRPEMELVRMETFGPVAPVIKFGSIDEAIRISNATEFGLSSSVCTNRWDYIQRFIAELQVGSVNIREVPGYRLESTPFGGIKDSGLGFKEGVIEAMHSFSNVKTYSLPWEG
ncbi:phosphonoacetaldehyde dehydrogenase [Paracidovorax anthurii]|uniref:Aldehyde dehydrogenase (NAD+) n=1 Tax=Paracidovorax anthurii TaxID=78229 RepID=A0A328Z4M1_9BURK|nr:phosphonoacetaldehyde dehydrogenase [Paracidovorax anthurii]RAR77196.1 aldehyde dehydrogenase (NAD+) [Paracidovorax anthurii]